MSKDDLVLTSGTYQIDAASHGLSGKDGIHAENADDTSLGFVYLADGTFDITSDGMESAQETGFRQMVVSTRSKQEAAVKMSRKVTENGSLDLDSRQRVPIRQRKILSA